MEVAMNKIKSIERKVDKLEEEVYCIKKDVNTIDKETTKIRIELQKDTKQIFNLLKKLDKNVDKFKEEINEIKLKPAKKWDNIIMVITTVIVTSFVNYFIMNGGF